jgi:predicted amidophosphoribosyltransferase
MGSTQQAWNTSVPAAALDCRPAECLCGQDLDLWAREHCPRCGTHLRVAHAA